MRAISAAAVTVLACAPAAAFAAERTVTENATYVMGDNDTRAQAVELCIAKIERKALEGSGALVESELEMISDEAHGGVNDTAHQRVRSYVGAVVKATGTHVTFHVDGERIAVDCNATVAFDPDEVKERLRTARTDDTTKAKVDQQQERIAALEIELQDLRTKLAARPIQQVIAQPAQPPAQQIAWRTEPVLGPAPNVAAAPAGQAVALAPAVTISFGAYAARLRNIRPGMTETELVNFVGNPRGSIHEVGRVYSWNYGSTWVTMNAAKVQCVSLRQNPNCEATFLVR
jgi:hypothetical protein